MATSNVNYDTYVCRDKYYPHCEEVMKSHERELISYVIQYIDENNEVLLNSGLYQLYWNTGKNNYKDSQILFDSIGMSSDQIAVMIEQTGVNNKNWKVFNKPHNWAFIIILKYFYDLKKNKELEIMLLDLSFSLYATLFYKYFRYPPQKNIMDYTVNNLTNRHDLKKYGNLLEVLRKISIGCHEKYKSYLEDKTFSDRYIVEYVMNLNTRINSFIKIIRNEYEKNRVSKKYLNYDKDDNSEENYHENTNQSYDITRLSDKITNKLITSTLNEEIVVAACKITTISVSALKTAVVKVLDTDIEGIKTFNLNFLQQYLIVEKHSMESFSSKNYLTYVNKIYSKSNVNDKSIITIKELLDKWLKENCEQYSKTERVATLNNYRKAMYLFFTLSTQAIINNTY